MVRTTTQQGERSISKVNNIYIFTTSCPSLLFFAEISHPECKTLTPNSAESPDHLLCSGTRACPVTRSWYWFLQSCSHVGDIQGSPAAPLKVYGASAVMNQ